MLPPYDREYATTSLDRSFRLSLLNITREEVQHIVDPSTPSDTHGSTPPHAYLSEDSPMGDRANNPPILPEAEDDGAFQAAYLQAENARM